MKNIIKLSVSGILSVVFSTSLYAAAYPQKPVERTLAGGIKLFDYSAMVVPQVGVDCGLHALKNGIALFNYFAGRINEQERDQQLQGQAIGAFQGMDVCRVQAGRSAGSLDPEEIATLAYKLEAPFDIIKDNKVLILDNLADVALMRNSNQNKQLATVVEDMRAGNPFLQAFILGNMDQVGNIAGHWVAAVLRRENAGDAPEIHTANSSGPPGIDFDITMAEQLLTFLNRLDPKKLRFRTIKELFHILRTNYRNELYDAVVQDISDIVAEARAQNIFNLTDFNTEELIDILINIDSGILSAKNEKLKDDLLAQLLSGEFVEDVLPNAPEYSDQLHRQQQEEARQRAAEEAEVKRQEELRRQQVEAQQRAAEEARQRAEAQQSAHVVKRVGLGDILRGRQNQAPSATPVVQSVVKPRIQASPVTQPASVQPTVTGLSLGAILQQRARR